MAKDYGKLRATSTDDGMEFYVPFGDAATLSEVEVAKLISGLAHWLAIRTSQNQKEEIKRLKSKVNHILEQLGTEGKYLAEEEE